MSGSSRRVSSLGRSHIKELAHSFFVLSSRDGERGEMIRVRFDETRVLDYKAEPVSDIDSLYTQWPMAAYVSCALIRPPRFAKHTGHRSSRFRCGGSRLPCEDGKQRS